ncbi:MAG: serine/threonine-protein phosphatase, partial [Roseomonas sp.]|nr:serine/threonine-protein phosphatase [Roseomonas sp.]
APAGLTMARTLGLMRAAAKRLSPEGEAPDPGAILTLTNDDLSADNESQTFVTVVVGVIDGTTGAGRVAVAGHDLPVVLGGGAPRLLGPLRRQPALGVMEGIPYASDSFSLAPGESLFCYSDGVSEAEDNQGGFFGQARLMAALAEAGTDPRQVVEAVLRAVSAFADGAPQADDITALALRHAG